jgi:zinc protease
VKHSARSPNQRPSGSRVRQLAASVSLLASLVACAGSAGSEAASPAAATPLAPAAAAEEGWRAERPAPGAARPFEYPAAQLSSLPNGVQLYLVPRRAGTVALAIMSRSGGATNGAGQSGLAALTLRLMTEATKNKAPLALAEATESLGASFDFDTGRDGSSLSLEVLPGDVDAGLALLAEVIAEPRLAPDDVARVKKQWLDSLVAERQEPSRLSSLAGMRALLGMNAGAPVRGSIADVQRLTAADLSRFHRQHYVAGNLAVIAVGDLDMPRLEQLASASLGRLPKVVPPPSPALVLPPPPEQLTVWVVDRPGSVQTALFAGQPFPERSAPGYEAREVMNNLFGGLFTSRLNQNLREKHAYTYGARSVAIATRRWGVMISMSSVKTENTAEALAELRNELRKLRTAPNPITADELARSKVDLIHGLGANLEHVSRVLGDTGELFAESLPADYHHAYSQLVQNVDAAAVFHEAERIDPDHLVVVLVGDRARIEPALEAQGLRVATAPARFTE